MRLRGVVALLALAPVLLGAAPFERLPSARVAGPVEIVFDWSRDACAEYDIPDLPVRAFRDASGQVHLMRPHTTTRAMVGPTLDMVRTTCDVVLPSHMNPNPAAYDSEEWLGSTYTTDGTTVHALVHNEFHGATFGLCSGVDCWYDAVTAAISTDGGRTFTHPPGAPAPVAPPHVAFAPAAAQHGYWGPSNIVRNDADGFYYAFVMLAPRPEFGEGGGGGCLMRTRTLEDPRSWRAWDGDSFDHRFADPYREPASPRPCQPFLAHRIISSLTYNTYLERWVATGTQWWGVGSPPRREMFFYSTSRDLVRWTRPRRLFTVEGVHTFRCGDPDPVAYGSLLDPASSSRNFETTGQRAYLYYTQFNYRSCGMTLDRDLVRVPIEFAR